MSVQYTTTRTFESSLYPGVICTLKRVNVRERAQFNQKTAAIQVKMRDREIERSELAEEYNQAAKINKALPCTCGGAENSHDPVTGESKESSCRPFSFDKEKNKRWLEVSSELEQIRSDEFDPALVEAWCIAIEGLEIDQKTADVPALLSAGDPALVAEIAREIEGGRRLSSSDQKNSSSPTTSGEPGDGRATSSPAETASSDTCTS